MHEMLRAENIVHMVKYKKICNNIVVLGATLYGVQLNASNPLAMTEI